MRNIAVIGLGYVGLPVAVAFGKTQPIIGFDIDSERIADLKKGVDNTLELTSEELLKANVKFTADSKVLQQANFYIICVPTPIDNVNQPDLTPLLKASEIVGTVLKKNDIVVYESTVYPGATEEDCMPMLEQVSGMIGGKDFFIGYSPERINPGDKKNKFTNIKKIVAGQNQKVLDIVTKIYESVVSAGVYKVSSIKTAEAAKIIENSQRDLNIAFVNELSKIFQLMKIDTKEVLDAASTKWNFLRFNPGLVGGHCIGVDPYYLTFKSQKLGYHPEVLLAGRRINDDMPKYIAEQIIKKMISFDTLVKNSKVAILGVTSKENCPDIRNSKIFVLINELEQYHINLTIHDPIANPDKVAKAHNLTLSSAEILMDNKFDVVIIAVAHQQYREGWLPKHDILIDIKAILPYEKSVFRL